MRKIYLPLIMLGLLLTSCWGFNSKPVEPPMSYKKVWGYKPVFTTDTTILQIKSEAPRTVVRPGKIYVKGNLVFQNDIGSGIHVIDNSDPAHPVKLGFIRIWGSSEMSIKGNYLYSNCLADLVVVDVSDWQHVVEVKREKYVFSAGQSAASYIYKYIPLPERGVYYDCMSLMPSPTNILTGWVRDSVLNYCYNP